MHPDHITVADYKNFAKQHAWNERLEN